ncbi:TetR/AcrR family transcriptional regulator [Parahaliea mediterranea]|uniref:TetR/AcrR family transcriptional regulator n=1 Tax=Parahaliea mediterranea TaxID=651086 RepID=A0A939DHW9_9GAMM|nr:TetR/AcrR family transcriptional regulator [Parahaliea mediterranea]MBN7798161.1 TetR/AcrR family transcriptional regulator [Parahaliea mediterranea]
MPKIVDHDEQRLQLSATVAQVVAEAGLEHTTLRTVAAHHGCTKGMVQHYFADKDELLLAALNFVEDQCEERLPDEDSGHEGLDLLHARLAALLPVNDELVDEWRVRLAFVTLAGQSDDVQAIIAERQATQQAEGVRLLRQAQRAGQLKKGVSPVNAYRLLSSLVNGLGVAAVVGDGQWSPAVQKGLLKGAVNDLRR